jgi:hypothetical protein
MAGRLAVPTIVIDERVFLGFVENREEIESPYPAVTVRSGPTLWG